MISLYSSVEEFQKLNREIYLIANDRYYSIQDMLSRLHRHATHVMKGVRKEKYDDMEYHLCMAFSWAFALANRLHIDLAEKMWEFFPGCCPYCLSAPCSCKERPIDRQRLLGEAKKRRPFSLCDWQFMFSEIYPNSLLGSAMHLSEEIGEVSEAIRNHLASLTADDKKYFQKLWKNWLTL